MKQGKMTDQEKALQALLERAQQDSVFRAELTANPTGVLERELGMELPADADVRIVEETPNQVHLILPTQGEELSAEALEEVTAGLSALRMFRARLPRYPGVVVS